MTSQLGRGQPATSRSSAVALRDNAVRAVRDTITSGELDDLPRYLADMYREQRRERQREQQLAARDRERLDDIDRMWKEFEGQSAGVASPSNDPAGDRGVGPRDARTAQTKPGGQQVRANDEFVARLVPECR